MRVLIDADPIVYADGFAAEERWYELHWVDVTDEDNPYGDVEHLEIWKYKKDAVFRAGELDLHPDEYKITRERRLPGDDPIRETLGTVKATLNNILRAVEGFLAETNETVDSFELFLTDSKSNFRLDLATIRGYKANRDPNWKPILYDEIRDYMVNQWGARIMKGCEADDALCMAQRAEGGDYFKTCIVTIDKDLKMVPGLHYNYRTKEDFFVSEEEALEFFYWQLLTGDSVDNIAGCKGFGAVKARKLLDTAKELYSAEDGPDIPYEDYLYALVLAEYEASATKWGPETYGGLSASDALLENARLLWMQREPGELWTPPGDPMAKLPGYEDD